MLPQQPNNPNNNWPYIVPQPQVLYWQPQGQQQFPQQTPMFYYQPQPFQQIPSELIHQPAVPSTQQPLPNSSTSTCPPTIKKQEDLQNQVPGQEDFCKDWRLCSETKDLKHRCTKRHLCTIKECSKTNDKVHVGRFLHECKYGEKCRNIDNEKHNHNFIHPCKYKGNCKMLGDVMHKIFFSHPTSSGDSFYPGSWGKVSSDDHFKCVKLSHTSKEFKELESKFLKSINHRHPTAQVIDIERVENVKLWKAFSIKKSEIIHKNSTIKAEQQVKTLYHGADELAVNSIIKTGFDYRQCQVGHYGHGNYFAVNASYSHGYANTSSDGSRRIIVCKVVVGESLRVSQKDNTLRRPQDKTSGKMYDSVQGGPTGTEYVLFDNESSYPEFIVIYK